MFSLRSISIKGAIALIALAAPATVHAQINPANQINWPTGAGGCVYAPGSNTCVPNGGGGATPFVTPEASGAAGDGAYYFDGAISTTSTLAVNHAQSTSPSASAVTTNLNNDRVISIFEVGSTWSSVPATGTNRLSVGYVSAHYSLYVNDQAVSTAGSVSAVTGTLNSSAYWIAATISLAPTSGTPVFVNATSNSAATTSVSTNVPSGTTSGMIMVGCIEWYSLGNGLTWPVGFTGPDIVNYTDSASNNLECKLRVATNEPSSYTWIQTQSYGILPFILTYSTSYGLDGQPGGEGLASDIVSWKNQ